MAISQRFDVVVLTLEDIEDGNDKNKSVEAKGLLLQIRSFSFLLNLVIFDSVFVMN